MPAYCRPIAFTAFQQALVELNTTGGLFRAAFAIALHERPEASLEKAESTIVELGETVNRRVRSPSPQARVAHLHDVLFDLVGFRGNSVDYYNPANSYLPDVLATRCGLPIVLVLIYKCVAERVGLEVKGVNSPGHFLAAIKCPEPSARQATGGWMFVDPFHSGDLLDPRDVVHRISETAGREFPKGVDVLQPASNKQWILRMLQNLQAVFARAGREKDLFAMHELQTLLTPPEPSRR